jgi:hypothetical protein
VFPVRYELNFYILFSRKKENSKGKEHNELPWDPLEGRSSLSSPQQSSLRSYTASRQATPATTDTAERWKNLWTPVQEHLPRQEIQKTGLSVQAPSSSNSDTLKVATEVQQNMKHLSDAVSEKDIIVVITKMVLNLMKQNGC